VNFHFPRRAIRSSSYSLLSTHSHYKRLSHHHGVRHGLMQLFGSLRDSRWVGAIHYKDYSVYIRKVLGPYPSDTSATSQVIKHNIPSKKSFLYGI